MSLVDLSVPCPTCRRGGLLVPQERKSVLAPQVVLFAFATNLRHANISTVQHGCVVADEETNLDGKKPKIDIVEDDTKVEQASSEPVANAAPL